MSARVRIGQPGGSGMPSAMLKMLAPRNVAM